LNEPFFCIKRVEKPGTLLFKLGCRDRFFGSKNCQIHEVIFHAKKRGRRPRKTFSWYSV